MIQKLAQSNPTFRTLLQQVRLARKDFLNDGGRRVMFENTETMLVSSDCVDGRVQHPQKVFSVPYGCIHHHRTPGGVLAFADKFAEMMTTSFKTANSHGKKLLYTPGLHRSNDSHGGCAWIEHDFERGVRDALITSDSCIEAYGSRYFGVILRAYNTSDGRVDCYLPSQQSWTPMHQLDAGDSLSNLPIGHDNFRPALDMLVNGLRESMLQRRELPQQHEETGFVFTDATLCVRDRRKMFIISPYLVSRDLVLDRLGRMVISHAASLNERPLIAVILHYEHGDHRSKCSKSVEARVIARQLQEMARQRGWDVDFVFGVKSSMYQVEIGHPDENRLELVTDSNFRTASEQLSAPFSQTGVHAVPGSLA